MQNPKPKTAKKNVFIQPQYNRGPWTVKRIIGAAVVLLFCWGLILALTYGVDRTVGVVNRWTLTR